MPILTDSKKFIQNEFSNLNLGDKRLNRRALEVAATLNSAPSLSIPSMTGGNDDQLKGIYRFFQNDKVCDQNILQTHYLNTLERMQAYNGKILLINDSTFVTPSKYFEGLMSRGKGKENCVRVHYCIAISENGNHFFGLLDFNVLSDIATERYTDIRNESDIWILTAENCINHIRFVQNSEKILSRCIFVADREADEFELMYFLKTNNLNFVIRSQYDRKIIFEKEESKLDIIEEFSKKHGSVYSVKTKIDKELVEVKVKRSVLRDITIIRPISVKDKFQENLIVNTVIVSEDEGEEHQLKWRLLTNEPVNNSDESSSIVSFYSKRWAIEEINKAAKTGVRIEDRQFTELKHFLPFLAMAFVIAWRMVALRTLTEISPKTSIDEAFTEDEVGFMKAQAKKLELPIKNVSDAIYFIARLGGFTGRYKKPGWQILWGGWMKFYERVAGYVVAKEEFS